MEIDVSRKSNDIIRTVVGAGTVIKGEIIIKDSGRIDGLVEGTVTSDQDVVIGEGGEVSGDIVARRAMIGGKVNGFINAKDKVVLEDKGHLDGNVRTRVLKVADGAFFHGNCIMLELNSGKKL